MKFLAKKNFLEQPLTVYAKISILDKAYSDDFTNHNFWKQNYPLKPLVEHHFIYLIDGLTFTYSESTIETL